MDGVFGSDTVAWDLSATIYLVLAFRVMLTCKGDVLRARAARQDDSRVVILVIILLAIGASFVATGGLLAEAKDAPHRTLNLGLAAATIIVAAAGHPGGLHASLRTRILSSERWPAGLCRRARFSGRSKPGLLGVLLFRDLVWGSITDVRCVDLRRLATLHAIISFSFNTAVLALAINLAASMI